MGKGKKQLTEENRHNMMEKPPPISPEKETTKLDQPFIKSVRRKRWNPSTIMEPHILGVPISTMDDSEKM